jgi:hypothetical protein
VTSSTLTSAAAQCYSTLPLGTVADEPEPNPTGERLIWLEEKIRLNKLDATRKPGEGIVKLSWEECERTIRVTDLHAAATTSRHVLIAAARSTRCD